MFNSFIAYGAGATPAAINPMQIGFWIVLWGVLIYFLMIRPNSKRKKKYQELMSQIAVGDTVVTTGGIMGEIQELKETSVVIKTGGSGRVEIRKTSILSREN